MPVGAGHAKLGGMPHQRNDVQRRPRLARDGIAFGRRGHLFIDGFPAQRLVHGTRKVSWGHNRSDADVELHPSQQSRSRLRAAAACLSRATNTRGCGNGCIAAGGPRLDRRRARRAPTSSPVRL